jgi:two-component system, repressor protein LuxO
VSARHKLLLVEDHPAIAQTYLEYLRRGPYEPTHCDTGKAALAALGETRFAVVLLDLQLPDMAGLDILKSIVAQRLSCVVIVITANGSINVAVEAMREGAADFLVKPFAAERLFVTIEHALERHRLKRIVSTIPAPVDGEQFCGFIGGSLAMRAIYRIIDIAATTKAPVFITGESGTGKELAAEAIHQRSQRGHRPFVALNCAAMPKDLMESEIFGHVRGAFTGAVIDREGAGARADGGTLFLDEICEMDVALQAKLLRFVQTSTFTKIGGSQPQKSDIRFIAATNRDPMKEVEAGRFREDLYYRLYVMPLALPPLRERDRDLAEIAQHFLKSYVAEESRGFERFSAEAERILLDYAWPGNVRQLQNVVRQIVLLNDGTIVTPDMLPPPLVPPSPGGLARLVDMPPRPSMRPPLADAVRVDAVRVDDHRELNGNGQGEGKHGVHDDQPAEICYSLAAMERGLIELALVRSGGNIPQAALLLDVSPSTLYRKREQFDPHEPGIRLPRELKPLAEAENDMIRAAIAACGGNISRSAALLGINPSTLYRKMQNKELS